MKSFREFLTEHILNVTTPEDKEKHAHHVWNLLQRSYKDIGGFHTAKTPWELAHKSALWKIHRKDGKVTAVQVYKDLHGRKVIAAGTNGSEEGKKGLMMIKSEDLKLKRAWGEFSGAMEHIMKKSGAQYIPHDQAEKLTGKPILKKHADGIHYDRDINGHVHTKALMGFTK